MRILHVFRAPLGGLFRHVLDAARGQIERGHEVGIFCDSSTGGTRADEVLGQLAPELALGLHRAAMHRPPHPGDLSVLTFLSRVVGRQKPDVLHGHGSKGGAYARLVPARHPVRAYTPHGGSFNYRPGTAIHAAYMGVERLLGRRTDVFLFESEYVRDRFRLFCGATQKLVRVVHNGVAASEYEPIERVQDPFDLVYIGELREAKGVDVLLEALARIKAQDGRTLTLLAVGSGPSEAVLKGRAAELGLADTTTFAPPRPIRAALAQGRVMVIPSRAESLPYVILEAAAAAQPLVATDVGGIREIFGPSWTELVPAGDADRLASAMLAKLNEPEALRHEQATALSQHMRNRFDIDVMVEGGLTGYRDAIAARRVPATSRLAA